MENNNIDRSFKPTVEWMAEKYDEMNAWLFNGELGDCNFDIFTTGKGSQGRYLGLFSMKRPGLKVNRVTRRIYLPLYTRNEYADRKNFYDLCRPTILLNGHYTGTEEGFLTTLVHEMCHYYCDMYGILPKQSHGTEFRYICSIIQSRSGGRFTIQRVASAEQMSQLDLSPEMQAKRDLRAKNKASNTVALLFCLDNGTFRLFRTSVNNKSLMDAVIDIMKKRIGTRRILATNNSTAIEGLSRLGYNRNFRTWRYWEISDAKRNDVLAIFNNAKEIYSNPNMSESRDISTIIKEVVDSYMSRMLSA